MAGNRAAAATIALTVDKTPPMIIVSGAGDGQYQNTDYSVFVTVEDAHRDFTLESLTVNGNSYFMDSIFLLGAEATYALHAEAKDLAGNAAVPVDLTFVLDKTKPVILITGAENGQSYNHDVVLHATVLDLHRNPGSEVLSVNGLSQPLDTDLFLAAEQDFMILAQASDLAGNVADPVSLSFIIDKTPPAIQITGVEDGAIYNESVAPHIVISDLHLASATVTINGAPYASDTPIVSDGAYLLLAEGIDVAGNHSQQQLLFEIRTAEVRLALTKEVLAPQPSVLVWLQEGRDHSMDPAAVGDWIEGVLDSAEISYFITSDQGVFVDQMRTGLYNVFIVVNINKTDATNPEIEGRVLAGDGLIIFKNHPEELPKLRDLLGVHWLGRAGSGDDRYDGEHGREDDYRIAMVDSAVSPAGIFTVHGKFSVSDMETGEAQVLGELIEGSDDDHHDCEHGSGGDHPDCQDGSTDHRTVVTVHPYGLGAAMVMAFDPTAVDSSDQDYVASVLVGSISHLTPPMTAMNPLGVIGVGLEIDNIGIRARFGFEELPAPELTVIWASDGGTVEANQIAWHRYLNTGDHLSLDFGLRLPDLVGTFPTVTEVRYLCGGTYCAYRTYPLDLRVNEDSWDILASVEGGLTALTLSDQEATSRDDALAALAQIMPGLESSPEGIEAGIGFITLAMEQTGQIEAVDVSPILIDLGRLLTAWEAKSAFAGP